MINPLTEDQNVLRTRLAPGLLQNVRHNIAHDNAGLRLFEVANIFHADPTSETTAREEPRLGIALYGALYDSAWPQREADADYTDLRGIIDHLLKALRLPEPVFATVEEAEAAREGFAFLAPCVRVSLPTPDGPQTLGFAGRVKPDVADAYHARKPIWLAELDLEQLQSRQGSAGGGFAPLPVFPAARRDITVMAAATLSVATITEAIRNLGVSILESVELVDLYEPEKGAVAPERNLTFRLTFRRRDRTLKDSEVDKEREKVAQALVKNLGVRV